MLQIHTKAQYALLEHKGEGKKYLNVHLRPRIVLGTSGLSADMPEISTKH